LIALFYDIFFNSTSNFFDSPLNQQGIEQAQDIATWLQEKKILYPCTVEKDDEVVVAVSNLRRAQQTVLIALQNYFLQDKKKNKLFILSSLQEISNNVDTIALCPATSNPILPQIPSLLQVPFLFDTSYDLGNKDKIGTERIHEFCQWAFSRPEKTVIVGCHSLWARSFFRLLISSKTNTTPHIATQSKISNGGIVSCSLSARRTSRSNKVHYFIHPDSIQVLGSIGFEPIRTKPSIFAILLAHFKKLFLKSISSK